MTWWIWLLVFWAIGLSIGGLAILAQHFGNKREKKRTGYDGYAEYGGWTLAILCALMLLASLAPIIQAIGNHQTSVSCHNWGIVNNRLSKYVVYTFWNTDCVTPSGNGHWISTSDLTANNVTISK